MRPITRTDMFMALMAALVLATPMVYRMATITAETVGVTVYALSFLVENAIVVCVALFAVRYFTTRTSK